MGTPIDLVALLAETEAEEKAAKAVELTEEEKAAHLLLERRSKAREERATAEKARREVDGGTREAIADSLRVARRIAAQPALAKYQPTEWRPGPQYQSDEELARLAGDIGTTIFHPVGTTKMGADGDPMAVLDSQLRVRGVTGLRVVDAGAMPAITSGNTNSPTLMMAEKASEWILADASGATAG